MKRGERGQRFRERLRERERKRERERGVKYVRSDICSKDICPTRCLFEVGPNQRRLTDKRKEKQRRKKETEKKYSRGQRNE